MAKKKNHRGRIQAQGGENDFEASKSWAKDAPLTKKEGLNLLDKLKTDILKTEVEKRAFAFRKAEEFIKEAAENGGVEGCRANFPNRMIYPNGTCSIG